MWTMGKIRHRHSGRHLHTRSLEKQSRLSEQQSAVQDRVQVYRYGPPHCQPTLGRQLAHIYGLKSLFNILKSPAFHLPTSQRTVDDAAAQGSISSTHSKWSLTALRLLLFVAGCISRFERCRQRRLDFSQPNKPLFPLFKPITVSCSVPWHISWAKDPTSADSFPLKIKRESSVRYLSATSGICQILTTLSIRQH